MLAAAVGGWLAEEPTPIRMCGMVGARHGWVEAPYVDLPARVEDIARSVVKVDTALGDVAIVPGIAMRGDGERWADVMRGEETQVFGALGAIGRSEGTFVLPGTHAKWVTVEGGAITRFRTFMTGDIYAALRDHTILSATMGDGSDPDGFMRGVFAARELNAAGDLLARLFSLRAEALMGRLSDAAAPSLLSGLLIGAEVLSAAREVGEVVLVGGADLVRRYAEALSAMDVATIEAPQDCAMLGLSIIGDHA